MINHTVLQSHRGEDELGDSSATFPIKLRRIEYVLEGKSQSIFYTWKERILRNVCTTNQEIGNQS